MDYAKKPVKAVRRDTPDGLIGSIDVMMERVGNQRECEALLREARRETEYAKEAVVQQLVEARMFDMFSINMKAVCRFYNEVKLR